MVFARKKVCLQTVIHLANTIFHGSVDRWAKGTVRLCAGNGNAAARLQTNVNMSRSIVHLPMNRFRQIMMACFGTE